MPTAPRVFISYCHYDDKENFRDRVLELAQKLRRDGVHCEMDQFHETTPPSKGWPRWMLDELEAADFVVVVCTPTYYRRFRANEAPGLGAGGVWEGGVIIQSLYDAGGQNNKFIPVGFAEHKDIGATIPDPLRPTTYRNVSTDDGYKGLLRQIHVAPAIVAEPVGTRPPLPTRPFP